ncbi:MAG: ice-binding family protein [Solirubrobacteraceae bacterium]
MSKTSLLAHAHRVGILFASGLACALVPAVASASAVNLGTASPFVVLGGSTVTNTGPSVLNGDLGVAPGTSLVGFGLPAVVNGATQDDDAAADQAQSDVTTAYKVAAGQPVSGGNKLTGQDLGGMRLTAGAYSFSSSAQLTGQLTLDAAGDPNAQFVFEIGSSLTTASESSIQLINGASPCNVYWQVGSSATLGSTTAFKGNLMANISITVNDASTVQGRLFARTGAVTLDDNVIDDSMCRTSTTPPPGGPTPPTSTPTPTPTPTTTSTPTPTPTPPTLHPGAPPAGRSTVPTRKGSVTLKRTTPSRLTACHAGFTATVRGVEIKRVVFRIDGKWLATRVGSPFRVHVPPAFAGSGLLEARVTFKNATPTRTLSLRYQACAAAVVQPLPAPSTFTG